MQISFSATEIELFRKWVLEPLVIPLLGWVYKRLKTKINLLVTENVNRIRDELKIHVDEKIKEHEEVELKFFRQLRQDFEQKHLENKQVLTFLQEKK